MWAITLCSVWPTSSGGRGTPRAPRRSGRRPRGRSSRPPLGRRDAGSLYAATARRPRARRGPPPAPWRRATAWTPARRGRTTCAAASPRSPRAAAAAAAQVGAVVEALDVDPEHLVRLTLVPGGAREDAGQAGQRGTVRYAGAQQVAAQGPGGRHVEDVQDDVEPRGVGGVGLVDRAEPVEEGEALGHQLAGRAAPLRGVTSRQGSSPAGWSVVATRPVRSPARWRARSFVLVPEVEDVVGQGVLGPGPAGRAPTRVGCPCRQRSAGRRAVAHRRSRRRR